MGAGRRWVEGRWRLGGMRWQCSPSLLEGHQVLVRSSTRAGELEAAGSLLGRKYFSAKGVSCLGSNPAARHWLGDLQSALQDRQHLPRMGKHPAAACTGQAPEGGEMAPLHGISSEAQPTAMLSCNHLVHNKNQRKEKGLSILWDQSLLPGRKGPHQLTKPTGTQIYFVGSSSALGAGTRMKSK